MKLTSPPRRSNGAMASSSRKTTATTGRPIFASRTSRSCWLPGSAQCRLISCLRIAASDMREYVLFRPAGEVEQCARRQEVEAGLGELLAVLALQPLVELGHQRVQIANVARRIFAL